MDKFHITFYNECNYLSILRLKSIHVSKRGPSKFTLYQGTQPNEEQAISNDSYWKEFFDSTIVILPDIVLYFSRNVA